MTPSPHPDPKAVERAREIWQAVDRACIESGCGQYADETPEQLEARILPGIAEALDVVAKAAKWARDERWNEEFRQYRDDDFAMPQLPVRPGGVEGALDVAFIARADEWRAKACSCICHDDMELAKRQAVLLVEYRRSLQHMVDAARDKDKCPACRTAEALLARDALDARARGQRTTGGDDAK